MAKKWKEKAPINIQYYSLDVWWNRNFTVYFKCFIVQGATQKFGEFKQRARTGCRMAFRRYMWLAVCFVNQYGNSCQVERMCYYVQCIFVRLCFSDPAIFLQLIRWILRGNESASNFDSILKKLLQKPTECYRKPSEIMPWAKAKLFFMVQTLQGRMNICQRRRAFWTTVDNHNTSKHSKCSRGYPCRS